MPAKLGTQVDLFGPHSKTWIPTSLDVTSSKIGRARLSQNLLPCFMIDELRSFQQPWPTTDVDERRIVSVESFQNRRKGLDRHGAASSTTDGPPSRLAARATVQHRARRQNHRRRRRGRNFGRRLTRPWRRRAACAL